MRKPFNEILKSLREERGLSQQELANALSITRSTLGNRTIQLNQRIYHASGVVCGVKILLQNI